MITVKVTITGEGKHYSNKKTSYAEFPEAMELVDKFLEEFPNGEPPEPTPWKEKTLMRNLE